MITEELMKSGAKLYKCETWEDFTTQVRKNRFASSSIYRGHSDPSWRLMSLWERHLETFKPGRDQSRSVHELMKPEHVVSLRDSYLEQFKYYAVGLPDFRSDNLSEIDWWALGRHYGLKTPLLDWSASPYIAAFFAFTGAINPINLDIGSISFHPRKYIAIWALSCYPPIFKKNEFELVHPSVDRAYRQKAQRGTFSLLTHDVYMDVESYLASNQHAVNLEKYEIPTKEGFKALRDLSLMNITYATLFPDLEGAVKQANFQQVTVNLRIMNH